MKSIKLLAYLLITAIVVSCSNLKPSQEGTLSLKNGDNKEVDVKYSIAKLQYDFFISQVKSKSDLQIIADLASSEAKSNCKFTPTYEPTNISFMAEHDTITVFC